MTEKILLCNRCSEEGYDGEVYRCDWCDSKFDEGDKILCFDNEYHFCSQDCFEQFVIERAWDDTEESEVVSEEYEEDEE